MIKYISNLIIPLLVLIIIIYAIYKKVNVYDAFVKGAKEGFSLTLTVFPYILGMIFGVGILLKSQLLDVFFKLLNPIFTFLRFPIEVMPLAIMRPISGNASLAILNNIFINYGTDSFIGKLSSVIQASTDTTLYVLALYFGSVGIKKIKYALWAGLLIDLISIIVSTIIVNLLF